MGNWIFGWQGRFPDYSSEKTNPWMIDVNAIMQCVFNGLNAVWNRERSPFTPASTHRRTVKLNSMCLTRVDRKS